MKTKIIIIGILLIGNQVTFSQVSESGDNQSSILIDNTNIGFNLGKSQLSFSSSNYTRRAVNSSGFLYGFNASGKQNDGLTNVFNSGYLSPTSKADILFGYHISNRKKLQETFYYSMNNLGAFQDKIQLEQANIVKKLDQQLWTDINNLVEAKASELKCSDDHVKVLKAKISEIQKSPTKKYLKIYDWSKQRPIFPENEALIRETVQEALEKNVDFMTFIKNAELQKNEWNTVKNDTAKAYKWKYFEGAFYFTGGIGAEKFYYFKGWDSTNITNSFEKINHRGGEFGIGVNFGWASTLLFGARYLYQEANNSSVLNSNNFEYTLTQTSGGNTYTTKESFTALSGAYGNVYLNRIDLDLSTYVYVKDSLTLLINGYADLIFSNNDSLYTSTKTIGVSTTAFKTNGKLLGGFYVEIPDLEQNIERRKPDPNLRPWYNRITFGLYAKYSLQNLFLGKNPIY